MSSWRRAAVLTAVLTGLIAVNTVSGATPPTVPDGVIVTGRLAAGEASGTLRLEAPTEATVVILVASGLDLERPPERTSAPSESPAPSESTAPADHLPRTAISFSSSTVELTPGKPVDILVTVKGFRYAGTYTGTITVEYAAPPAPASPPASVAPFDFVMLPKSIPLTVSVTADPAIASVAATPIKITKTKCFDFAECLLAEAWANHVELTDAVAIDLRNSGQAPGRVINPVWTIVDRETRTSPSVAPIEIIVPASPIPAGGVDRLTVTIDRHDAKHGEHDGTIAYTSEGVPGQTTLAFELTVRERPLWLLFWIVVGVGLAWFVNGLTKQNQQVAAATAGKIAFADLRKAHPADIGYVAERIAALQAKPKWTSSDQAEANAIATDLASLDVVRTIEARVDDGFVRTQKLINETRDHVKAKRTKKAMESANAAKEMVLVEAQTAQTKADARSAHEGEQARESLSAVFDLTGLSALPRVISPEFEARAISWLYRGVRLLAAVAFLILGLKLAYLDTVGFTGASARDVITLITYGAGADVVSRYLSGFLPKSA